MSESVYVPPSSTHKTSQVELRCFFPIGSYSYLSIQSRALSNGEGGYISAPTKMVLSVHVPYTTNPPVIIRKLLLCYYYYPWMDGVGSSSTSEKIKRSEGEKTVNQESFYIAAACCV